MVMPALEGVLVFAGHIIVGVQLYKNGFRVFVFQELPGVHFPDAHVA